MLSIKEMQSLISRGASIHGAGSNGELLTDNDITVFDKGSEGVKVLGLTGINIVYGDPKSAANKGFDATGSLSLEPGERIKIPELDVTITGTGDNRITYSE